MLHRDVQALAFAGLAAFINACASTPPPRVASAPPGPARQAVAAGDRLLPLYEAQRQVEEYIRSGRYDADVAEVVEQARRWLEERSQTAVKPAIVLDIDETSLSN